MSSFGLAPGTLVAGQYRVVRPLSEGAMGAVYVAEQTTTKKERALKVMQASLVGDARLRERFAQEAQIGAAIESEHVVEVIDAGIDASLGLPWLAMELLRGETLGALCARGAVPPATVREIFGQFCHALGAAHDRQIVHRDLKPDNVFLATARREGVAFTVKVLDFGIAKLVTDAQTQGTAAIGTPLYMAPEQARAGSGISPATDVWALGLIAFRMLTGRTFWRAGNFEGSTPLMLLQEVAFDVIPSASQRAAELGVGALVPPGFDAWFARSVARSPAERFAHARLARQALEPLLEQESAAASASSNASAASESVPNLSAASASFPNASAASASFPNASAASASFPNASAASAFPAPPTSPGAVPAPSTAALSAFRAPVSAPPPAATIAAGPHLPADSRAWSPASGTGPPTSGTMHPSQPRKSGLPMWVVIPVAIGVSAIGGIAIWAVTRSAADSTGGIDDYLKSSKTAEAKNNIRAIARGATEAYERETLVSELDPDAPTAPWGRDNSPPTRRLCGSAEQVPSSVPRGTKYQPNFNEGSDYRTGDANNGWKCLRFDGSMPQYYQYSYVRGGPFKSRRRGNPEAIEGPDRVEVTAEGDLDGDGETSLFAVIGKLDPVTHSLRFGEVWSDKPNE